MSLKSLATKVIKNSQKVQGASTSLGNAISTKLFGNSTFLRNEDNIQHNITGLIEGVKSLGSMLGAKDNKYIIGRIEQDLTSDGNFAVTRAISKIATNFLGEGQERGVIIDGYDEMSGELTVGLPSQPVMYTTNVVNQRVRNPDTFKMRVYVTNLNSDDIVDSLTDTLMNVGGGIGKLILNPETRAFKALSNLKWIQENGSPFKIYTPVRVYENMLIEKIQPITNKSNYDMLVADIYFREVVFAQSLGNASKASARTAPSAIVGNLAKAWKWLRG